VTGVGSVKRKSSTHEDQPLKMYDRQIHYVMTAEPDHDDWQNEVLTVDEVKLV